ncbi:sialate O-acetylesterase [Haloferula rosea]|uniref:Cadherin-like domain-containing protein n=1 Tax=Haloferula rosea TaxID=490093 RepID=A0A934RB96_9BACT|nr:sialate O-acetylesterase [Haloferula rosea]MBK1827857.1 cadherin-like domain-containing protein [Haloferula rosea]
MIDSKKLVAAIVAVASPVFAGTVSTSASAPTVDLISSSPSGGTDTALFDEDANANHARGQLFNLPDGGGSAYEITAITVKKSQTQTYVNDTLTLRIFEGTESEWNAGTGHSTATDGSDYLVDTEVTLIHTESFNLNTAITDNHYVTFQLATPIVVNEDSDFGFFMTYDQGGGTEDRFRHREAGSGGGRISITTTSHGTSGSRRVVFFVQGSEVTPSGTVTASASAPTADILATKALGATGTNLFTYAANSNHARGQLFSLGDGSGSAFEMRAVTIQKSVAQSFVNDTMTLHVFKGTEAQWNSGTGHIDTSPNYYGGTTVTPIHTEEFTLNGTYAADEFITFELALPIELDENEDYGFFFTYDQVGGSATAFGHLEASNGGRISIDQVSHNTSSRSMNHFVIGVPTGTAPVILTLGSPFQDRMILQRDKPINIWGEGLPSTSVSVSINGTNAVGTSDANGDWKIELPALASGGPYELAVTSGGETVTVNDVLVGDVWFCFGQSNMVYTLNQMAAWHTAYENDIIANDNIRCLKIDQDGSLDEEEEAGMNWLDNSTAGSWTAVGSVFAHQLNAATGVPVGIVWAAWGSSSIEGWMPLEMTERQPYFAEMMQLYQSISEYRNGQTTSTRLPAPYTTNEEGIAGLTANGWSSTNDDIFMRTRPNILYNKMVHPIRCMGISGFIWYQGEANAGTAINAAQYGFSLPDMVTEYRERFGQGDLPFLGVQLPSYDTNGNSAANWPWFREAQARLETIPNGHVAVTIDTGTFGNIHPTDKEPIGIRLSLLARKYQLGESIVADGPRFDSMSIAGDEVTITFANGSGLNSDVSAGLFQIAGPGSNPTFHEADSISVSGNQLTISSTSVPDPVEVRYAWIPVPNALTTLENGDGLPATPFRTDSFPLPGLGAEAPQSIDDDYEVAQNGTLNVGAVGVLANDIDLNRDVLTATLLSDVSDGTLSLQPDGSFSYIPHSGFAGTDSFTYECSDGALTSGSATVTITVTGIQTGYYTWRSGMAWSPGDDETETGDPDLDGVANLMEYALMLDPLVSDVSGLPTLTPAGADFVYDFNNGREGVLYEVLLSPDLVTWSDPAFASITSGSSMPVLIPSSEGVNGRLFVRLRVSEP